MKLSELLNSHGVSGDCPAGSETARAYVRVSHERSAEKNTSPETQRRRIEAYAREHGYHIAEWYTELAKSAFREDVERVAFERMLADAKADPATSVILVYRYDRFSRAMNAAAVQGELLRCGVRIESAEEGYYDPDSEVGAIMMPLTWSLNRLFSIKLRNVVIPNMKTNFEQRDPETGWAYKNGGWAQFGYRTERVAAGRRRGEQIHKQIWLLDDREFGGKPVWQWARTMLLEWRLREQCGYDTIAGRLTEAGVPTPTGRSAWSNSSIQSLLGQWDRLYQYAGYAFWNREDCTDRGNRRTRDTSEWITVPSAHPAIITEDECSEIWAMVSDKRRAKGGREGRVSRWLLSGGLLKCRHCGANFSGTQRHGTDYYACGSQLYRRGAGCEASWYIPREEIEGLVLSKIARLLSRDEEALRAWVESANAAAAEWWQAFKASAPDRKRRITEHERKLHRCIEAVKAGAQAGELAGEIRRLSEELQRMRRLDGLEPPPQVDFAAVLALRDEVRSAIDSDDHAARGRLMRQFVVEILVDAKAKTLEGHLVDPRAFVCGGIHGGAKGS